MLYGMLSNLQSENDKLILRSPLTPGYELDMSVVKALIRILPLPHPRLPPPPRLQSPQLMDLNRKFVLPRLRSHLPLPPLPPHLLRQE